MRKLPRPVIGRQLKSNNKLSINIALLLVPLLALLASPLQAADATDSVSVQAADKADSTTARVTQLSQAAADTEQSTEEELLEEVVVTGTQIKGAAISEALSVSVFAETDIEMMGISSGDELLDAITEQG